MNELMTWAQVAVVGVMLIVHWVGQIVYLNRRLSQYCERVDNMRATCDRRGRDHANHYQTLHRHSVRLENHEGRITALEKT
jgi:hypothetical protein